jgi:hypothetical protein
MPINHPSFEGSTASRSAGALAAALLAGIALGACGSSPGPSSSVSTPKGTPLPTRHLNTRRVELAIAQSILKERRLHSTVKCPPVVPQLKGRNFQCIATTVMHGKPVRTVFAVVQKDSLGNVYYASPK